MKWTDEDTKYLRDFRNIIDSDDIHIKEKIKQILLRNKYIVHVLNNPKLADSEPDEYFGVNILPYYIVPGTQHDVQNFVCYTVGYKDRPNCDKGRKYQQIVFVILCEEKTAIDQETSLARHDLLAALITDQFNHSNYFGEKLELVSDEEGVTDNSYVMRKLTFEQLKDNNYIKTTDGVARTRNKDVVY